MKSCTEKDIETLKAELVEIKAQNDDLVCVLFHMIDEMSKSRSYSKIGHSWKQEFLKNSKNISHTLKERLGMEDTALQEIGETLERYTF